MATEEDAAKEILRIAVREQKLLPDQFIPAEHVVLRFRTAPWTFAQLEPGLLFAQKQGWITEAGMLTATGYAAAPG